VVVTAVTPFDHWVLARTVRRPSPLGSAGGHTESVRIAPGREQPVRQVTSAFFTMVLSEKRRGFVATLWAPASDSVALLELREVVVAGTSEQSPHFLGVLARAFLSMMYRPGRTR
jgi:hypothetical protein